MGPLEAPQKMEVGEEISRGARISNSNAAQDHVSKRDNVAEAGAYLDWTQSAEVLSAKVGGLNGEKVNRNPQARPNITLGSDSIRVNQLQRLEQRSGAAPGTLISSGSKGWCITTSSDDVLISSLETLEGNPVDPEALAEQVGLQPGKQLPKLTSEQARKITETLGALEPYERFWHDRLKLMQPIQLPYEMIPKQNAPRWVTASWCEPIPYRCARSLRLTTLGAFVIYLARLTGRSRLQIGWWLVPKPDQSTLPTILASTVPMECEIEWNSPFASIVNRIEEEVRLLDQNRTYPRDLICRSPALRAISELKTATPWQIAVSMGDNPVDEKAIGALLTLQIDSHGRFRWIYDTHRLEMNVIDRMSDHLRELTRAAAAKSDTPVAQLNLLPEAERKLLVETWNDTQTPYPDQACSHHLIEQQVARRPDATAVFFEDELLSYAQLNAWANQLAHRLIELDVKPDAPVAICVKRSPAMIVALLAVMKAGAAYVPLDPTSQSKRLTHILADVDPVVVLVDETGRLALGEAVLDSRHVLDPNVPAHRSKVNPTVARLTSRHLAYIIYTSGSTGVPKGIMIEHRSLVNLSLDHIARFKICAASRVLQFASFCWDASIIEIMMTLGSGASLYLLSDIERRNPNILFEYVQQHAITHIMLPPAIVQAWKDNFRINSSVTFILVGDQANAMLIQELLSQNIAFNSYGPTESILASCWRRPAGWTGKTVPIGRPLSNTRIYLLDKYSQLVPLGAVGELCIAGDLVARGYLNPELTAKSFFPDPFVNDPDARMYKTGDLARYLPDGNLMFLGRNDFQVKIRGIRIEPGEIEARLVEYPSVREAVVVALGEPDKRLIAYVVADEIEPATLREHLRTHLPDYMVPSTFVRLNAFPLTPNGKLDRKALPAPDVNAFVRAPYEAPAGPTEIALAEIWSVLLGVSQISRHDSFFALGGHSLLAVRLSSRIASLGAELSLTSLFNLPTLAAQAEAIQTQRDEGIVVRPPITPIARDGAPLPLSFAQQRLWFLAQLDGVSNTYHIPYVLRMKGLLNVCACQNALDTLWARHEALRSVFVNVDGQPEVRLLDPEQGIPLRKIDLEDVAQVTKISAEETRSPFDLTNGPLIRALLIRLGGDAYMLLLTQHHIISDGWSLDVVLREFNASYCAYQNQEPNPLPALSIQYPDYAAWQRQWLTSERREEQSNYWRTTLADAPVRLDLPTDRPRPIQQLFAGDSVSIELDLELTLCLKRLSQQNDVTLFMTLLAAWAAVLSRLSGQDDIVIGSPSANRGQPEIEPLIGFFVNTLAMRVNLSGHPSVAELLARVKKIAVQAQDHQDLPFEQVVEIVQPPRRLDHTPVFQVMFAWNTDEKRSYTWPGLDVSPTESTYDVAMFDLELNLTEINDQIVGELGFATALFNKNTIERQVNYLKTLLKAMVTNTDRPIDRIDILDSAERELLLEKWNDTRTLYSDQACIHQLFEQQAARTPNATAIFFENELLSYAQLNARANQLAHRLIELDVKPEELVVICVKRSPAMIVGLLAVLKAGAAYVPLDPSHRGTRLTHILADVDPKIVLADNTGRLALGEAALHSRRVLDPNMPTHRSHVNPAIPRLTSRHLAHVIYTSGSTGKPKGVMIEHRSIINTIQDHIARFEINDTSRLLQFASFGWDVSITDIFMALGSGASLYLPSDILRQDLNSLFDYLQYHKLTHINLPPIVVQAWRDKLRLITSRTVILGGEAPDAALIQELVSQNITYNSYGVTEIADTATVWRCPSGYTGKTVPIGRPISNTRLYLLDVYSQPVPLGAVGELYIGGDGVARGYLNPVLTTKRFFPDPFAGDPDARMYKTGDLARYMSDGNLEFLGRNDDQFKIRGFRIEPGEIEARLVEYPSVREAVVVTLGEPNKRLIAYVVADKIEPASVHEHLLTHLPEYMVPSAIVRLDAFPLTPNGKLDRRALPAPDANALTHAPYEAPFESTEIALAEIWRALLGVSQISRHDSFFALGGHSLLAVRLNSRITSLGVELPLATLYASPTLKALAVAIQTQRDAGDVVRPPITAVSRDGGLPLSFAQQRLWFLAQLDGFSNAYHIPFALRLKGSLNVCALQRVLDTLWTRHEALRTVFVNVDGQPEARLLDPEQGLLLRRIDLEEVKQLAALCVKETESPFDLSIGPLIRALLIRLRDDKHILLLTQHHIVSDGWSFDVLIRELNALYRAYQNQDPNPLPPLTIQYPDYAAWQRQWLTGKWLQEQSDYWRTTLADAPVRLDLPTDRPRPIQQSFAGDSVPIKLDLELTLYLKRFSQQHDVTLFMTLLAAWAAVLSRLSGQDDIVIGSPSANRGQPEIESLIGFFVNTLAMRVNLRGQPSVAELLARVKKTAVQAQDHQDLPFEQVVEIVQPPRRLDHTPVFQVMFAWQTDEKRSYTWPGLDVSPIECTYDVVQFDLELNLEEINDQIVGELRFATALFNKNTVERQVNYLKTVLKAMAANVDRPIDRIDILDSAERELLLEKWNDTRAPYHDQACIHQLFEQQVARTPNATAIFFENELLSYAQLNARANQLAHRLIELDVEPEELVVICVKRSPAMIVGLLAVLKAGAAYVPLDPAHRSERLTHILADVDPKIVLADDTGRLALGEAALSSRRLLDPNLSTHCFEVNPAVSRLTSRHLAYVIYTSGSTGTPKGVMIEHRGIVNLIQDHIARFEICDASRVLQFSSFCWDVSIREIFMALCSGASLYLLSDIVRRDPNSLSDYLQHHAITHINLPPVLLQAWRDEFRLNNSVTIILSGEAPDAALLQELVSRNVTYNSYGGTENTDIAAVWRSPAGYTGKTVPIGRPISNMRIYLLDAHGQPVPLGAVGELYISGDGVARGYLNSVLTAERFFPDPFAGDPDARMYKTGDLARYLSDGNLEFLGRNDDQLKIRGFRIEPGEIEARLVGYPSVREAVVVTLGEQNKRLIAYVVADKIELVSLREHLLAHLPDYMVPSAIVRLDAFPLTPNGKLDRQALPAPDADALTYAPYEAPVESTEIALADIWRELLGVSKISRHDSFFALGGHSLLAVRLNSRITSLGAELPLATLFESPTLKALAVAIQTQRDAGAIVRPPITSTARDGGLPPSFAQQRLWFLAQLDGVSNAYHVPFTLRLKGRLNVCAWQRVLDTLWARHEALRTVFINVDGEPEVRLLDPEQGLPLRQIDLVDEAQLAALCAEEVQSPFDLTSGPLMRALLIRVRNDEHMFLLTQHHIIFDGWSIDVLLREFSAVYRAYLNQEPNPLPSLTIQYPDYAAWQREWLTGERLQKQHDYWRTTLADAPVRLVLPTDRPRPIQQSFAGDFVPIELDLELTLCLKRFSQQHDVTLFMTLLAAWAAVLSRLSGQDDIVIGSPSANRGQPEIESLIGFFVNTLAIRVNLRGQPSVAELLARVKKTAVQAQDHQDLPFEQVVEIVQPPRCLDHTPVFQVMFAWQSDEKRSYSWPGLDVSSIECTYDVVKFDLELNLEEINDQIVGELRFATALFNKNTVERQVNYLTTLLKAMTADADRPIDRIDILDSAERELLLEKWNDTRTPYPDQACIHQLFEQQVARTPNATAIFFENEELSFAQLNTRANQLAHRLIELDLKPDELVVICVKRSPAMIVSLLAVLKAGAAYVPLDPTHRGTRLTHILADADPVIVLADEMGHLALGKAALSSRRVLDPNQMRTRCSEVNPAVSGLTSRHLAHVIYTSGSTGTPKGVMIEHRGLVNLVQDQIARFEVCTASRILQFASFCWDVSITEIFMALNSGASLYLLTDIIRRDPNSLSDYLQDHAITHINLPPVLLQAWRDKFRLNNSLKIILEGETPDAALLQDLVCGNITYNAYGLTETTDVAAVWRCPSGYTGKTVPIGRPISNTRFYLLDVNNQPIPLGAVGELYIGGDGVARGYLNPELTAERFFPDPFAGRPDARMYKSGDLARYLSDGSLVFVGRNDHQLKIHGFRIEPGEIEARLVEYPSVREAVVVTFGEPDKRLVAYVVADQIELAPLREHLLTHLPDYMIPSAIVRLDAFPLTPNGKLDRRALPAPDADALTHASYEAPVGSAENALANIWRALLGVSQISRHDSFFALGGHSLLAVRLNSRIASLGAELSLASIFNLPTLAAQAEAIQTQRDEGVIVRPPITPIARDGPLALSFAQQRLWFLAQLDGVSNTYHIPYVLRMKGLLNVCACQKALDTLWARHEALRSVFANVNGQPEVRLLDPERGIPLRQIDLEDVAQVTKISAEETRSPFDLTNGPLIRALLIRLGVDAYMLLLTQHHIVSDGWSLDVLLCEFNALYCAYRNQELNPLPPLSIQYPDYAAWQRQWLTGKWLQKQSDYWKTTLADAPVRLDLPTDRPRPNQQSFTGDSVPIELDLELTSYLKRLSQQHDVTLFMTLLAAWAAVLSRLSGQDDIVIGSPSANRGQPEIEPLIGFFVNTLAMRVNLSGQPSVAELLTRVKKVAVQAQDHQDLPFEQVVEIVQPPRRLDHTPVFQVMFAWQSDGKKSYTWPDLDVSPIECTHDVAKFDLELYLAEINDQIVGDLGFATALFNKNTVERQVNYFKTLLKAMAANADRPIDRIDILDSAEREVLLENRNDTRMPYPDQACIHQLFEQQVARTPNATAIFSESEVLSYAQLNTRANQLAHRLIELDLKPDELVVICVQRSPTMIVGLLAVLKAGAAYVPLNPAHRSARLTHILADVDPAIVLADEKGRLALGRAALDTRRVLDPNIPTYHSEVNPTLARLTSRHLAYVIYTSGSTGTPKGVMVEHRGLVNLAQDHIARFEVHATSRVVQFSDFCWDVSVAEIMMALASGARLYLPCDIVRQDPYSLFDYLQRHAITHIMLPPVLLQAWRDTFKPNNGLTIILGGEAPNVTLLQELLGRNKIFNCYGPTESTICATVLRCQAAYTGKTVPIGRPISNTRIYLLDAHGQPVPHGALGELHIGGDGVSRGYLNRPDLTAERFLPDPFGRDLNARMYKTGDLARYLPNGNLLFLGRNDQQVKIRGFRIELGEVEVRLAEHPAVRETVVVAVEEPDKRLIAYVVADKIEPASLREHLLTHLPDYMIPSAIVRLDAFPLTPNGKIDRQALPAPDADAFTHAPYEAPVGSTEIALAEIWRALLGVSQISRHDSFFALGGHSLLAVRLNSRITSLGVELPLVTLYASPTLKALAEAIQTQQDAGAVVRPPITAVARDGGLPLSFAQKGLWFLAQLDGFSNACHSPFNLHLKGPLDVCALQRVLDTLWTRHEALRTVFFNVDGQPEVRLLDPEQGFPLRRIDLEDVTQLAALCAQETLSPFDLSIGPLIRALLIRLRDDEHMFLLTQHHIVTDGWSIGVLIRELNALYHAYRNQEPNPLPPLSIQYPDYAAWQRQWLTDKHLKEQRDYWRTTMLNAPMWLDLPTDRPRPIQQSFAGDSVPIELDLELTLSLKHLCQQHDVTLYMIILAAWAAVLSRLSGQDEIIIGSPSANRGQREVEPLIGLFVNMLAMRVDLRAQPSIAELLARVKKIVVQAQAHQDLPFEQVVEIVQPSRRLDRNPLFQVIFAWQNNEKPYLSCPGLDVSQVKPIYEVVKYDLELELTEINDQIVGDLGFPTALFNKNTIERQANYLKKLLKGMAANADYPIERIDILDLAERELLLEKLNDTQMPYPDQACIHQLFEQQVARTPDATAIFFEGKSSSYAQLNARANQLAHQLIELDLKPDERVIICVKRSPAMIVGLLAVLKAGAAYVPLDPTHQGTRLAYILADADPKIVVADETGRLALGKVALDSRRVLDPNMPAHRSELNPTISSLTFRHLAHVLYTSGFTGTPIGVMVEHRGLVNLALDQIARFQVHASSRIVQFSNICWDASIKEIVMALASGASLYLLNDIVRQDPKSLADYLRQHAITHIILPPVLLRAWRDTFRPNNGLTIILGEDLPNVALLQELLSQNIIFNCYGPTESTVCATVWRCPAGYTGKTVPIGRPISNTRIYLLDAHGQPVPFGASGELYIVGDGVARGYLNRHDLTSERFLPDPFGRDPNARMYKTGDLARYLPNGNLLFLGRNDHQVKIRGFRIEPGEVEAKLAEHPAVRETVVVAVGEPNKCLIAYVVADEIEPVALREHLRIHLPEYMIPTVFMRLDAFPVMPNGKLDHRALPAPDTDALTHVAYEAPIGAIETTLAEIWQEVLGVDRVRRDDSFFAIGGHSLLAVKMIHRARSCGLPCSLNELFEHPLLASLAARMTPASLSKGHTKAIPVRPTGSEQPVFFVPSGLGDHSYVFSLTRHIHEKYPVYALPWPPMGESFPSTIEAWTEIMITFMKAIQPKGPYRIVGHSSGGILAYSIAESLSRNDNALALVGLIDTLPPQLIRNSSSHDLFFEYVAQNTSAGNMKNIVDLSKTIDNFNYLNLVRNAHQLGLLGTNLPPEFFFSAWKRIHLFSQAASSYEPPPLPLTVHQFHATEKYSPRSWVDDNNKSLSQYDICSEWKNALPDQSFRSIPIPGDHWSMIRDIQNRSHLGEALSRELETFFVDPEILAPNSKTISRDVNLVG